MYNMEQNTLKINNRISILDLTIKDILIIFGAIFCIRPYYVQYVTTLNDWWKYIAAALCILLTIDLFITNCLSKDYSKVSNVQISVFLALIVWFLLYIIVSGVNGSDSIINLLGSMSGSLLAFSTFALIKDSTHKIIILKWIRYIYYTMLVIDLFTIYTNLYSVLGMNFNQSFLGQNDNYASFEIVIMLAIIYEISYLLKGKLTILDYCLYIAVLISKIYTFSVAAIVTLILFGLIIFIKGLRINPKRVINLIYIVLILGILLVISVSYLHIYVYIEPLINAFGKSGFGYREYIWPQAIEAITQSPLFGYGELSSDVTFQSVVGLSVYATSASHCHNLILEILFRTGIVGLVLCIYMVCRSVKNYSEKTNSSMLLLGLLAYLTLSIMDGYIFTSLSFGLLGFMAFYKDIFQGIKEETQCKY